MQSHNRSVSGVNIFSDDFFVIRTDHKSIRELLQQIIQTPEKQRYVRKLLVYHFQIDYKTGKSNIPADALSRLPEGT